LSPSRKCALRLRRSSLAITSRAPCKRQRASAFASSGLSDFLSLLGQGSTCPDAPSKPDNKQHACRKSPSTGPCYDHLYQR
jgi:hypothetical protein